MKIVLHPGEEVIVETNEATYRLFAADNTSTIHHKKKTNNLSSEPWVRMERIDEK